jgi:hypothetical protein
MDVNELAYHVKRLRVLQVHLQETVTVVARITSEAEGVLAKLQHTSNEADPTRPILHSESPFVPPQNLPIPPSNLVKKKSSNPVVVKVEPRCNAHLPADTFYQNPGSSVETGRERKIC